jgi:hypothetical protein
MKKIFSLTLLLVTLEATIVDAQVTIGSINDPHSGAVLDLSQISGDYGLLLPRVKLRNVNDFQLPGAGDPAKESAAIGMIIFNESTTTIGAQGAIGEYVWDGGKWRPLAIDGGTMNLIPGNYLGSTGNELSELGLETSSCRIENQSCNISGNYNFSIIAGNEYAAISPSSSNNPVFSISFSPNQTGWERKAIVHVTDPCGKTSTFVFTQKSTSCGTSDFEPEIEAYFNAGLRPNSAVYAYVKSITPNDPVNNHNYYWVFNNSVIAQGEGVTLTASGIYEVYADNVGCGTPGIITVTSLNEEAPMAKRIIVDNNGIVCGSAGKVRLQALNVTTGENIYWFKDGIRQNIVPYSSFEVTGADCGGVWYAVTVDANGRTSVPSNMVNISYANIASIPVPEATVNGKNIDGRDGAIELCANGTLKLEVTNRTDPNYVNPVFTWYANDQELGKSDGRAIYVTPSNYSTIILSVEVSVTGYCPSSVTSSEIAVSIGSTPSATVINVGDAEAYICGVNPAILTAGIQDANAKYEWFKSSSADPIVGAASYLYHAGESGSYKVRYSSGDCWSQLSPSINVVQSNAVSIQWDMEPGKSSSYEILNSSIETYSVKVAPGASEFTWTTNDAPGNTTATITPLGNGASALVAYQGVENNNFIISVTAKNGCGESTVSSQTLNVKNGCVPVTTVQVNASKSILMAGESVTYTAVVNAGSPSFEYEWHIGSTTINTGTSASYTYTPASSGTYNVYVVVYNACTISGKSSSTISTAVNSNPNLANPNPPTGVFTIFMNQKTCLDVHQTGDNGTNSWKGERLPLSVRPNDFAVLSGNVYNFSYTFTGSGSGYTSTVASSVKYTYKDPNSVVDGVSGDGSSTCILRLKSGVVAQATGRLNNNPVEVILYAVYSAGGMEYKDSVIVNIQDAACGCPAKVNTSQWKMFMCHAAGADYSQDPFVMTPAVYGAYYKWGRKTAVGNYSGAYSNGVSAALGTAWDMVNENPCPRGWKICSETELFAIANTSLNSRTELQSQAREGYRGQLRGPYLPISGGGYRTYALGTGTVGGIAEVNNCHTWSANATNDGYANNRYFYRGGDGTTGANYTKSYGEHLRCVSEGGAY